MNLYYRFFVNQKNVLGILLQNSKRRWRSMHFRRYEWLCGHPDASIVMINCILDLVEEYLKYCSLNSQKN